LRFRSREPGRESGSPNLSLKKKIPVGGAVFIGAHDCEHARRLRGVGRVFGAAVHVEGVVVHFKKVRLPGEFEVADVGRTVRKAGEMLECFI
jgi:hypothetical protein